MSDLYKGFIFTDIRHAIKSVPQKMFLPTNTKSIFAHQNLPKEIKS